MIEKRFDPSEEIQSTVLNIYLQCVSPMMAIRSNTKQFSMLNLFN